MHREKKKKENIKLGIKRNKEEERLRKMSKILGERRNKEQR
jgi:hypothetical protein